MDIELIEIGEFLSAHHPFDMLPRDELDDLPGKLKSIYARRGTVIYEPGDPLTFLNIVRTGAVETHAPEGHLLARLSTGELFGIQGLLNKSVAVNKTTAIEDTLYYQLPVADFDALCKKYPQFNFFFAPLGADRLRDAKGHNSVNATNADLMSFTISDLLTREPVTIRSHDTVQAAAIKMRDNRVSCLLVVDDEKLSGILTDRDLRNRLVAEARDYNAPVWSIMTADPVTLEIGAYGYDALLTMTRHNIRHLPICDGGRVAGVVTITNLVQRQTKSAVYLVGDIYKQTDFEGLAQVTTHLPELLVHLVDVGASAHNIGHIITSITDALTHRLIDLAIQKSGPPPIPYLWVACGSQARQEQTGHGDQDNCLILDDSYDEAVHGAYFENMANFVCDGLNAAGYVYCPGEVMAKTPKWRQPLSVWRKYFKAWILQPEPKALMLASIFFDQRPINGDMSLFESLKADVVADAQSNNIFLAHLVGNAIGFTPPLGFFRNFVVASSGEHKNELNLKQNGVVPVVDIARVYALQCGVVPVNTNERLFELRDAHALSPQGVQDLEDALEFIAMVRLVHQANRIKQGEAPNNYLNPDELSQFERSHLKDAFSVIKTIQSTMASTHRIGL
ncbi:MAG: putative nucleotidyltransferase substrate binding domain-containing protein [Magnetospiraceae bacterium]